MFMTVAGDLNIRINWQDVGT